MNRILSIVVMLVLLIPATGYAQSPTAPRFEPTPCSFTSAYAVECGFLVVPEDRGHPNGPTIKLAVAIFSSTSDTPGPPTIRLDGGPGGHSIEIVGEYLPLLNSTPHLLERGDLILLDQRGVGLSKPSLACTEVTDFELATLDQLLTPEEERRLQAQAVRACYDRLVAQQINLSAYNSAENAADVFDLWTTLGYQEVNIYGVSYGTRLALTMMRDFPEGIRSVILDSAFPPQADLYVQLNANAERAIRLLFDECADDVGCNRTYPDLEEAFFQTIEQLNAEPARLQLTDFDTGTRHEWVMTGTDFYELVFQSLYVTQLLGSLPALIYQTYYGSYELVALLAGVFVLDFTVDLGMYFSVQCVEEVPFQTADEQSAVDSTLSPPFQGLIDESLSMFETCAIWGVEQAGGFEEEPVISNIPTLIVAGEYDPITPPAYGRAAAETLSRSYFFEYPGMGHGVFDEYECPLTITLAFLDNPTEEPDASCIEDMQLRYELP